MKFNKDQVIAMARHCINDEHEECPLLSEYSSQFGCMHRVMQELLDVIASDENYVSKFVAEVEELQKDKAEVKYLKDKIRADAIKEFADRVKKYYDHLLGFSSPMLIGYYIDQIAKEMLGGDGNASDQTL